MSRARKAKVSVTISADLLSQIDAFAKQSGIKNRSKVFELWLRKAAQAQLGKQLEQDTAEYYEALNAEAAEDDAEWSAASSDEFGRLGVD